jgi:hypothetical protein
LFGGAVRAPGATWQHCGKVIGQTAEFGFKAVADKVSVQDLPGMILGLLGIDHEKLTYPYEGRQPRWTDVFGHNQLTDRLTRG